MEASIAMTPPSGHYGRSRCGLARNRKAERAAVAHAVGENERLVCFAGLVGGYGQGFGAWFVIAGAQFHVAQIQIGQGLDLAFGIGCLLPVPARDDPPDARIFLIVVGASQHENAIAHGEKITDCSALPDIDADPRRTRIFAAEQSIRVDRQDMGPPVVDGPTKAEEQSPILDREAFNVNSALARKLRSVPWRLCAYAHAVADVSLQFMRRRHDGPKAIGIGVVDERSAHVS